MSDAPADYEAQIRRGDLDVVLVIDDQFAADVAQGKAGSVRLVFDRSRDRARASIEQAESLLRALQPAVGRAAADAARRRVDASPIRCAIEDVDLATPQQSGALVLFLVAYYGLFASVMGGMAVALDTTAGERERQSLEPLLMTPARPARDRHRQVARRQRVQCARRAADADRLLPDADVRAAAAGRRSVPVRRARVRPLRARARADDPDAAGDPALRRAAARALTRKRRRTCRCCCSSCR